MRTTMDLDVDLIQRLVKASGAKSKTEAIELAAQEYLMQQARKRMLTRAGALPGLAGTLRDSRRLDRSKAAGLARRMARGR